MYCVTRRLRTSFTERLHMVKITWVRDLPVEWERESFPVFFLPFHFVSRMPRMNTFRNSKNDLQGKTRDRFSKAFSFLILLNVKI